jgi:hypothetical protein
MVESSRSLILVLDRHQGDALVVWTKRLRLSYTLPDSGLSLMVDILRTPRDPSPTDIIVIWSDKAAAIVVGLGLYGYEVGIEFVARSVIKSD